MSGGIPEDAVFLVGFMYSGKTTAGRCLARGLGWAFHDTDAMVERREGRSVESIFRAPGEGYFRAVEWEVLRSLGDPRRSVVACGGGLFLGRAQRSWLASRGRTVWLDVPLEIARARARRGPGDGPPRPLWGGDDPLAQRALYERRRAVYALARYRVDARGEPEEVARRVGAAVGLPLTQDSC